MKCFKPSMFQLWKVKFGLFAGGKFVAASVACHPHNLTGFVNDLKIGSWYEIALPQLQPFLELEPLAPQRENEFHPKCNVCIIAGGMITRVSTMTS